MPAALMVMTGVHDHAKPTLDLEADDVRVEECACVRTADLSRREECGHEDAARMCERYEAHVVVIERVRGNAVGKRRIRGARGDGRADDSTVTCAFVLRERLRDACGRLTSTSQHDSGRIDERDPRSLASCF